MRSMLSRGSSRKLVAVTASVVLAVTGLSTIAASAATKAPKVDYTVCPRYTGELTYMSSTFVERPDGLVVADYVKAFMAACPSVKVKVIGIPNNELNAKLTAMGVARNMPDVFETGPVWAAYGSANKLIENMTTQLGADYVAGIAKTNVDQATINGKLAFAPWFSIPTAILYRTDIFKAAGLKPPTTWDDFLDVCKKLTKDTNGDGKIDQYGWAMVGTDNGSGQGRFNTIARNMGAVDLGKGSSGAWVVGQNTDGWKAALKLYKDAVASGCVPPGQFSTGYPEASIQVAKGQAAMMITGPHSIGVVLANNPAAAGKLAGAPIPAAAGVKPTTIINQLGFAISMQSKHKVAAAAFIKFALSKKWSLAFNAATYRLPASLEAQADPQVDSEMSAGFVKAGQGTLYIDPTASFYGSIAALSSKAYQEAIKGDKTIDAIAADYAAKAQQIVKDNA